MISRDIPKLKTRSVEISRMATPRLAVEKLGLDDTQEVVQIKGFDPPKIGFLPTQ